jgi:hypothetical protein
MAFAGTRFLDDPSMPRMVFRKHRSVHGIECGGGEPAGKHLLREIKLSQLFGTERQDGNALRCHPFTS